MRNRPTNPHEQMRDLDTDKDGPIAYTVEDIILVSGQIIKRANVLYHGPQWMLLEENDHDMPHWLNMNHVVSMRVDYD